jgi:membrane fusion protein (multidrug efflux system)
VKEGDLLYTIDAAPFQAKVAEAQGQVAEAQARMVKAASDLKRIKPLAEMNAVSKRDLDAAVAQDQASRASVDAAQANLKSAEIELGYTKITAPISGYIGLTKAKVGEYVGKPPNVVVLNTISQLDPIFVRVQVNERDYLYFARLKQAADAAGETAPSRDNLELYLTDGSLHPHKGKLASIDAQINPQTGTMAADISFPNPNFLVRPGQFGRVKVVAEKQKDAIVIPRVAVDELQGSYRSFVIDPTGAVDVRAIKLGPLSGNMQVVREGLKPGELVAIEGLQRLRPGVKVKPVEKQVALQQAEAGAK